MNIQLTDLDTTRIARNVAQQFQPSLLTSIRTSIETGASVADVREELARLEMGSQFANGLIAAAFWPTCGECGSELCTADVERGETTCLECGDYNL